MYNINHICACTAHLISIFDSLSEPQMTEPRILENLKTEPRTGLNFERTEAQIH